MGKHFADAELDLMFKLKAEKYSVPEIHRQLQAARRRRRKPGPDLTTVRRALKGATFKRSRVEARGARKVLSARNLKTLDATRKRLYKEAMGDHEIHWDDIIRAARVPQVHRTTVARSLNEAGYNIGWHTPRLKPERSTGDEAERKKMCDKLRKKPETFWTEEFDGYFDCKKWLIPRNLRGLQYARKQRVRGHLRKPARG